MNRGFTLIELIVTVAIVGLLASVALPMAELAAQRSREHELRLALREIRGAVDEYKRAVDEGRIIHSMDRPSYPPSLKVLVEGVADAASPDKKGRIYFLRRIPRDPLFPDAATPNDETWGKRDYASSADDPQEGDSVYDVYSMSLATGLNGIEYRKW